MSDMLKTAGTIREINRLRAINAAMLDALEAIAEGRGRFSQDQLTHAANTIDDMKELANAAIAIAKAKGE